LVRRALPVLVLLLVLLTAARPAQSEGFQGPLNIRNSHPLILAVGSPSMESARGGDSVSLLFTYSSTHLVDESPDWKFGIDLETSVLEVKLRKLLGKTLEASLDIPLISHTDGFLDGFLDAYHGAFGFRDYGRSERPMNEFLFEVFREGKEVMRGESGRIGFGDLRVGLKKVVYSQDPYVSVYGFLSLPTGNPDRGFGSGSFSGGGAVLVNKALSGRLTGYLNAGYVLQGDLEAEEDVPLRDYPYGGAALEWMYSERLLFNVQFFIQGSPFERTGIDAVDGVPAILSFGGRYVFRGGSALEFSLSEDPSTSGAPDFMLTVGYAYGF
jgi:hypothetical protein